MKFTIALLTSLIGLSLAAPAPVPAEEKRNPYGSVLPSFTHTWTDTPGVGFYTASSTGRVLFRDPHPISTHQTFTDASLRNQNVKVGFNKGSATITEGTKFRVHISLPSLDLRAGENKSNTNNQRDSHVATFEVRGGVVTLIEQGTFRVPDRAKFTLEIVGDSKNPPVADFWFNAGNAGLYLTRV